MYYYKKSESDIVKYEVECTDRKVFLEEFGLFGNTLNPVIFSKIVDYINGDESVVQDILSSKELDQHNYKKCFSEVEVARIPFDVYRRFIQFIGKKSVPVSIGEKKSAVWSSEQVCYMSEGNVYKKVRVKVSSETLHEVIKKMYLRFGDNCPKVIGLLEQLDAGNYKVVPSILDAIDDAKDKMNSLEDNDLSKEDARREYKFLYAPILNALRVRELVSITKEEFELSSEFLDIYVPVKEKKEEAEVKNETDLNIENMSNDAIKYVFSDEADKILYSIFLDSYEGQKKIINGRLVYMLEEIKCDLESNNIKSAEDWLSKYNSYVKSLSKDGSIEEPLTIEEVKVLYNISKGVSKFDNRLQGDDFEPRGIEGINTDQLVSITKEFFQSQKDNDKIMIDYWSKVMKSLNSNDRIFVLQLLYLMYAIENADRRLDEEASKNYQMQLDKLIEDQRSKQI